MPGSRSRLPERSVLVLTSLAGGDKHGYALIKDIEAFSGVTLGPGTLYGALARVERVIQNLDAQWVVCWSELVTSIHDPDEQLLFVRHLVRLGQERARWVDKREKCLSR